MRRRDGGLAAWPWRLSGFGYPPGCVEQPRADSGPPRGLLPRALLRPRWHFQHGARRRAETEAARRSRVQALLLWRGKAAHRRHGARGRLLASAPLQYPNRRATAATRRWRPARTFDQSAAAAKDLIEAGELGPACHKAERFGPATPWLSHAMPDHGSIARPRRLLARGGPLNLLDVLALRCSAAAIRRRQHRPASQLHLIALCAHCRRDLFRTTGADQLVRAVDGLLWPQRLRDEDRRRSMAIYHLLALAAAPAVVLGARHASGRRAGSARHLASAATADGPAGK